MQPPPSTSPPPTKPRASSVLASPLSNRRVLVAVCTCALTGGLAMLIWTKLRLVTGVPRTAYAQPEDERPSKQLQAPSAPSQDVQRSQDAHSTPTPDQLASQPEAPDAPEHFTTPR